MDAWIVERGLTWLSHYRRLHVRDERRDDTHQSLLALGDVLVCSASGMIDFEVFFQDGL